MKIDLDEAARRLRRNLDGSPWLNAVGVTNAEIVVYVTTIRRSNLVPKTWCGFPVVVRKMGTPSAISE